jgi:hypothetical protein
MRLIALLMLPALVFAAPVPKQPAPVIELKLGAETTDVLEITIQNNGKEPFELSYRGTPFEHISIDLLGEKGKKHTIQCVSDKDAEATPSTLTVPAGESKTLSLHTCHSMPTVDESGQKITFTARLKHGGKTTESKPLTVNR